MNTNSIYIRSLPWLLLWVVLAWFAGTWLHFAGADLWLFRGAMLLLGVAAWIGYIWYKSSHPTLQSGGEDVDVAVSEAELKLQASGLGRLANLPAFLLLGESGSAKTTTILRSGLDVELLSGLDQREGSVVATQSLNLWVGQKHVLIDPAGNLLRDPESRKRLIRKLESFQMSNVVAKGKLASRAAIVCISCDSFLGQGAADTAVALARHTREILGELCRAWKVRLPVYVLFTKLDLLTHFTEYAANLTEEEAAQVFGCMLAMDSESSETYSQRETQRMTDAFIDLEVRLRTRRLDLLGRENDENKLPSIYEFPREFGKMRSPVVNYLVDLCRPSQLSASLNPFLRGFYFVGVRPVAVTEAAPVRVAPTQRRAFDPDASSVFLRSGGMTTGAPPPAPPPVPASARKPQWVFLQHVLPRVVLGDRMALNFSQTTAKVGMWQSSLLAAIALSGIAMGTLWGVSFYENYSLGSRVVESSRALAQSGASSQPPSLETLRALDRLREPVETLAAYERSGHPASMGWGLYAGSDLFDPAYRTYFSFFQRILLNSTQAKLVAFMDRPNQTAGFQEVYDALKAYLITTSHPDKSTIDFLPRNLVNHWSRDQKLDQDLIQAAARQFQFYSQELPLKRPGMPVSAESQGPVTRTRVFLNSSLDPTPVYNRIVADVSTALGKFIFKKEHPGSESAVIEKYDVPGAFTKKGWDQMQVKLNDRKEYFSGEEWVVQSQQYAKIDPTKMAQALQALYLDDFVKNWRQYLHDGSVLSYASYGDAADKLQSLSGNQSPLLSLLCDASENTAVDNPSVAQLFDAPHQVVPPGCNKLLKSGNNTAYYEALGQLQSAMDTLKSNATSETAQAAAASSVGHANTEVGNLARGFRPDKDGHVDGMTQTLLHQPIQYAQDLLKGAPLTEANGKAKSLCSGFQALMQKYPFKPDSTVQASVQEVGDFFRPKDGALWSFYQEVGAKVLVSQGPDNYAPKPGSPSATRGFAQFFSGAAGVSHAFFPPDASGPNPALKFSVRIVHSDDIVSAQLNAGQQTVAYPSDAPSALTWPSPTGGQQITLQVTFTGGAGGVNFGSSDGPWAIFDFFTKKGEDWKNLNPSKATLNRISRDGNVPITLLNGHRQMVQLEVDTNGAPMILQPGYFRSLASCPAGAAVQ